MMSWVGVILQRLFEIYGSDDDPTERYFIVLMDEIDAHMHPGWQRILMNRLRDCFPQMQLFATTHSPLIIADLSSDKVFHVRRSEDDDDEEGGARKARGGKVEVRTYELTLDRLGSSQILTSPLFGLEHAQGETIEKLLKRYGELRGGAEPERPEELEGLARQLFGRGAASVGGMGGEVYKLVGDALREKVAQMPAHEQSAMLDKAEALVQKMMSGET